MLFDPIQLSRGLGPVGTILRPCENNIRSIPVADGFYRREIPPLKTVSLKTFPQHFVVSRSCGTQTKARVTRYKSCLYSSPAARARAAQNSSLFTKITKSLIKGWHYPLSRPRGTQTKARVARYKSCLYSFPPSRTRAAQNSSLSTKITRSLIKGWRYP